MHVSHETLGKEEEDPQTLEKRSKEDLNWIQIEAMAWNELLI